MKSRDLFKKILETAEDPRDGFQFLQEFKKEKGLFSCLWITKDSLQNDFYSLLSQLQALQEIQLTPCLVWPKSCVGYFSIFSEFEAKFRKNSSPFPFFLIRHPSNLDLAFQKAKVQDKIPVLFVSDKGTIPEKLLHTLIQDLQIYKFIFLDPTGPFLDANQKVVPNMSPGLECEKAREATEEQSFAREFFRFADQFLSQEKNPKIHFVFTSVERLFKELFTVKGSGTLVRSKSKILTCRVASEVDTVRLTSLMETSFRKKLKPEFWVRPFDLLFLEENYWGCVWMERTELGYLLSKFAVSEFARGLGVGKDLWEFLETEIPSFFWRSKPGNPIAKWYTKVSDGQFKTPSWTIFWKNTKPEEIPGIIQLLENRDEDFFSN